MTPRQRAITDITERRMGLRPTHLVTSDGENGCLTYDEMGAIQSLAEARESTGTDDWYIVLLKERGE